MKSNGCNKPNHTASLITICFVQIVFLSATAIEFFVINKQMKWMILLGPLAGHEKNLILACIELFIFIMAIVTINKRKWTMITITCVIVVLFADTFITAYITISKLYRIFFRMLWLKIADQSSRNDELLIEFNSAFLIIFIILMYSVFQINSIKILYDYKIFLQNESIELKSGGHGINHYRDQKSEITSHPPYNFYTI